MDAKEGKSVVSEYVQTESLRPGWGSGRFKQRWGHTAQHTSTSSVAITHTQCSRRPSDLCFFVFVFVCRAMAKVSRARSQSRSFSLANAPRNPCCSCRKISQNVHTHTHRHAYTQTHTHARGSIAGSSCAFRPTVRFRGRVTPWRSQLVLCPVPGSRADWIACMPMSVYVCAVFFYSESRCHTQLCLVWANRCDSHCDSSRLNRSSLRYSGLPRLKSNSEQSSGALEKRAF